MATEMPEMLVRVEYEIPPLRAIYATWYEDDPQVTDDDYLAMFTHQHPRAKIRKIHRGLTRDTATHDGEPRQ